MTPLNFTVSAGRASDAYASASGLGDALGTGAGGGGFGAMLGRAMESVVQTGRTADSKATAAIGGDGSVGVTEVVTAVSRAELALQTASTVRDRMVQAYQDIMRMPI